MGGRPAMPDNVRALRGNPGKRKSPPRVQPVKGEPPMPDDLPPEGVAAWKRVVPELVRLGTLAVIDRDTLESYCRWWDAYVRLSRRIDEEGETIKTANGIRKHPAWQERKESSEMVRKFGAVLGLSWADRQRLKAPEPETDDGDLD